MRCLAAVLVPLALACSPVAPQAASPAQTVVTAPSVAPPPPPPVVPEPSPSAEEWPCTTDDDCVLASRASLGCCDPCATVEAMSTAERDQTARLCGLDQGGETCPAALLERDDCPAEDPTGLRAACRDGSCVEERR